MLTRHCSPISLYGFLHAEWESSSTCKLRNLRFESFYVLWADGLQEDLSRPTPLACFGKRFLKSFAPVAQVHPSSSRHCQLLSRDPSCFCRDPSCVQGPALSTSLAPFQTPWLHYARVVVGCKHQAATTPTTPHRLHHQQQQPQHQ